MGKRTQFLLIFPTAFAVLLLLYKYLSPAENAFFPKCPVKTLTGLDCPGCGGQRAAHHLLNGELYLAFIQNPLLFILAPYLLLGFYLQLVPQPKPAELRLRRILYGQKAIVILGIITAIFTVVRNLI